MSRMSIPGQAAPPAAAASWFRRLALPVSVLLLIAVLDLATGRETIFYPFLVLAPALAAVTAPPLPVFLIGMAAIPLRYLLAAYDKNIEPYASIIFQVNTAVFLAAIATSTYVAWVRVRREEALAALTAVATAAQRAILLPAPEAVGGVRIAVRYFAVADQADLGGDLYAAVETPFGVRVLIGDVLGKGLSAVRTAAVTLGAFREAAYDEADLGAVARRIERSLLRDGGEDEFVTALFAEIRPDHVALLHRGHEAPVLVRADGRVEVLEPPDPGVPLGLGELDTCSPAAWMPRFGDGDLMLLVTDGIADTRNAAGRTYPLAERVTALLGDGRADRCEPAEAVDRIGADLTRHAGTPRFTDDALLLALRRAEPGDPGQPGEPGRRGEPGEKGEPGESSAMGE
ncbi:SpoIIE family protein phosphatase [Yinghuangia soli]|uniref:SpoIIE family protein phosphatase n=1 Tax=Yinghuangia soli TaxID=2908204 RepID=A0AA41PUW9_9ACTN|nr:SpoIIE family protein phosphatase [Yinghuangia soli]MCF2525770.1 SpoIIE family protein phosphatase [Yinghuangia soli]